MDGNVYFIVMLALIVGVTVLGLFKGKLKRKANAAGKWMGQNIAAKQHADLLETLGRTAVVAADADTVAAIVDGVVASKKKIRSEPGPRWVLEWLSKDDVVATLAATPNGHEVRVVQVKETLDIPQGAGVRKKFLDAVIAAARQAGHEVTEGSLQLQRQAVQGSADAIWVPAAAAGPARA